MAIFKTCPHCSKTFQAPTNKTIYCNADCYHAATVKHPIAPCIQCGNPVPRVQATQGRGYCSRKCYDLARKPVMISKICKTCGKTFEVSAAIAHRYTVCSWECRDRRRECTCKRCGKVFLSKESRWNPRYCSEECYRPPQYAPCKNCGKQMRIEPLSTRVFCSKSCYRKFQGETSIERLTRLALDSLGFDYCQEHKIGRYSVDFYLPAFTLVLEVDGDYWHTDRQRDIRKTAKLNALGYMVARISETEIEQSPNLPDLILLKISKQDVSSNGNADALAQTIPLQMSLLNLCEFRQD